MPITLANTSPSSARVGDLTVSKMYAGDTQVFPSFTPSGMVLGTESLTRFGTSYAQIPGTWVADSAYPGSSVTSNQLVAQTGGSNLTIQASVYCHNNSGIGPAPVWLRLVLNDAATPIIESSAATSITNSGRAVVTLTATGVTLAAGDRIRIDAKCDFTNRADAEINASTYVRIIQP